MNFVQALQNNGFRKSADNVALKRLISDISPTHDQQLRRSMNGIMGSLKEKSLLDESDEDVACMFADD